MNVEDWFEPRGCTKCGQLKPFTEFEVSSYAKDTLRSRCRPCQSIINRERRVANPRQKEIDRKFNLKFGFGMSVEEYERLFEEQNGVCAICHKPETAIHKGAIKRLAVDHCHETNRNRGLLRGHCNIAIGNLRDSVPNLISAIKYLQKHNQTTTQNN